MTPAFSKIDTKLATLCAVLVATASLLTACASTDLSSQRAREYSEQEIEQGEYIASLFAKFFKTNADEKYTRYLMQVGKRLLQGTPWEGQAFHYHVISTPDINAFSVPGGHIYVTSGLLGFLETEDQLASVLGHEFGHTINGHVRKRFERASATIKVAEKLSKQIGTQAAEQVTKNFSAAIIQDYTRKIELEADQFSSKLVIHSVYQNDAVLETLNKFNVTEQYANEVLTDKTDNLYTVFSSHPRFDQRLELAAKSISASNTTKPFNKANSAESYRNFINGLEIFELSEVSIKLTLIKISRMDDVNLRLASDSIPDSFSKYILLLNGIGSWSQLDYPTTVKWISLADMPRFEDTEKNSSSLKN